MSRQIYKRILEFKLREPNPYGYPIALNFRYKYFQPVDVFECEHMVVKLYVYMLNNLKQYNYHQGVHDIDDIITKCCTVDFHPDMTKVPRSRIHGYLAKLVEMNLISRAGERGYDYYVNPYFYNVLSRELTKHVVQQLELLMKQHQPL